MYVCLKDLMCLTGSISVKIATCTGLTFSPLFQSLSRSKIEYRINRNANLSRGGMAKPLALCPSIIHPSANQPKTSSDQNLCTLHQRSWYLHTGQSSDCVTFARTTGTAVIPFSIFTTPALPFDNFCPWSRVENRVRTVLLTM